MGQRKLATADAFLLKLKREGIVPQLCRRCVIDAQFGEPLRVYYECWADTDWLHVKFPASRMLKIRVGKVKHENYNDRG